MTKGGIPPYAAFVQSTLVLALPGKLVLFQALAVLCTDRSIQRRL